MEDGQEFAEAFAKAKEATMPQITIDETLNTKEPIVAIGTVVAEPIVEVAPVVEAIVPAQVAEVTENEPKSLLDILAETPVEAKKDAAPIELSDDVKLKIAMADEYAELTKKAMDGNPLAVAMLAGADTDKILEIARSLIPEDITKLSYEDLVRRNYSEKGLSGDLLEQAVTESFDEYSNLSDWKKDLELKKLQSEIKVAPTNNKFIEDYKTILAGNKPQEIDPKVVEQIQQSDKASIQSIIESFDGSDVFGYKFDKETIGKSIMGAYNDKTILPYINPDNSIDAKSFVLDALGKNWKEIAQAAYEKGASDERKKSTMPGLSKLNNGSTTTVGTAKTSLESMAEFLNNTDNIK